MNFPNSFFDELEKIAFEMGGVKFRRYDGNVRSKADKIRQIKPILRETASELSKRFPFNMTGLGDRTVVDRQLKQFMKKKKYRKYRDSFLNKTFVGSGGFSFPGSGVAAINRTPPRELSRRETIAHEAFHAKHPVLGHSETLARFAGGFKAPRKFDAAGKPTSTLARVKSGISSVRDYLTPDAVKRYQFSPFRPLFAGAHAVKSLFSRAEPKLGGLSGDDISKRLRSGSYKEVPGVFSRKKR